MRESDMTAPVAAWLRAQGLTVFVEVPLGASFRVVDMAGYDAETGRLVLVELKRSCSQNALWQAEECQKISAESYVALGGRPIRASREEAQRMGVGLLRVAGDAAFALCHPRDTAVVQPQWRQVFIARLSHMPLGGAAGLPMQRGVGPAKAVAQAVAEYRKTHPGAKWQELFERVPNHYRSAASMCGALTSRVVTCDILQERDR